MKKIFHSLNDVVYKKKNNGSEKIGSGGFGSVKLVHHRKNPKLLYAMKEILKKSSNDTKRIFQEIKLHKNLNHENIINFLDFLETKDKVHIFLEYASEGDLFTYIQKNKSLSKTELLNFFYQTCKGIGYIHAKDIMHRDLKPENILLCDNKIVKICDFGGSAEYRESETRETVCGTFEYMSPEVFFRNRQTKKTDIWALGILLFELFQGYAPFRGTRMELVMKKVMKNEIRFRKEIDLDIEKLIRKILIFDPKKRPDIEEILNDKIFDKLKIIGRNNFEGVKDNSSGLIYNNIKKFSSHKKCFKKKNNASNSNSKYSKFNNKQNLFNLPSQMTKPSINSNISKSPNILANKNSTSNLRKISYNSNISKNIINQGDSKKVNFNVYENYRNIKSKSKKKKIYSKNNLRKVPKKKYNSNSISRIIKKSSTPNILSLKKNSSKNLNFRKKPNYRTVDKKKQYPLFKNHVFGNNKISLDNKKDQKNINYHNNFKNNNKKNSLQTPNTNSNYRNNNQNDFRSNKNINYINAEESNKRNNNKYLNSSLTNNNIINNKYSNNNKRNKYSNNNSLTKNVGFNNSNANIYHKLLDNGVYGNDSQRKISNQNYNYSNKFKSSREINYRKNVSVEKKQVINTFGNYLNSLNKNFY